MIKILEGLYLGNREDARDLRRLRQIGITHVVNCACEVPNHHEGEFEYLALDLADPDPRMHECFPRVWDFIDEARRNQGRVLVHCFAAISRSPTIVLSYLCYLGKSLEQASVVLGSLVWTDPDRAFLEQLATFFDQEPSDDRLYRLRLLLHGATKTEQDG